MTLRLNLHQRLSICLRTRHQLLGWKKSTISNSDLLIISFFLLILSYYTIESRSYLDINFCHSKGKSIQKCNQLSYRVGKFLQKLGPLLHLCIASLFVPLSKSSILHWCFPGVSYERTIAWHRTISTWFLLLISSLHGIGFIIKWKMEGILLTKLWRPANFWGSLALALSLITLLTSSDMISFRRLYYRTWFYLHVFSTPLYLLGILWHHHGNQLWLYLWLPLSLFIVDCFFRFFRSLLPSKRASVVSATRIGNSNVCRLIIRVPSNFSFQPSQWMYVNLNNFINLLSFLFFFFFSFLCSFFFTMMCVLYY